MGPPVRGNAIIHSPPAEPETLFSFKKDFISMREKEKEKAAGRTKGQTLPFSNVCLIVQDEPLCVKGCF